MLGTPIDRLETPALLLDGPASDRNLQQMARFFLGRPCQLRPHFKNHKCTRLARRQIEAGSAVGMTCATLSEANILVEHGFEDILIANQVVNPKKHARLAALARRARISVAIDDATQATSIAQAAQAASSTLGLLIEIDSGMGRCGVEPGEPTLQLARHVVELSGVELRGMQSFEGHAVYMDKDERTAATGKSVALAQQTQHLLKQHGIPKIVISGGSSATYALTGVSDGVSELQCGTYATMDWRYQQLVPEFELALSVLTSVISRPRPQAAVLDVGVKGVGGEFGLPRVHGHPNVEIPFFKSEEHTVIHNVPDWSVGQTVRLIPSHACTTCNLYRQLIVHDGEQVIDVWPIEAAGM